MHLGCGARRYGDAWAVASLADLTDGVVLLEIFLRVQPQVPARGLVSVGQLRVFGGSS